MKTRGRVAGGRADYDRWNRICSLNQENLESQGRRRGDPAGTSKT